MPRPESQKYTKQMVSPEYLGDLELNFLECNTGRKIKVMKRGDNLTGGDRFSALFIMLQWAYPIITAW